MTLESIFSFQDVTQNADWNKCLDVNGMSLARCIYNCEDNGGCENECVAQFKSRTADCPCEVFRSIINIDCSIQFDPILVVQKVYLTFQLKLRRIVQPDAHATRTIAKMSIQQ